MSTLVDDDFERLSAVRTKAGLGEPCNGFTKNPKDCFWESPGVPRQHLDKSDSKFCGMRKGDKQECYAGFTHVNGNAMRNNRKKYFPHPTTDVPPSAFTVYILQGKESNTPHSAESLRMNIMDFLHYRGILTTTDNKTINVVVVSRHDSNYSETRDKLVEARQLASEEELMCQTKKPMRWADTCECVGEDCKFLSLLDDGYLTQSEEESHWSVYITKLVPVRFGPHEIDDLRIIGMCTFNVYLSQEERGRQTAMPSYLYIDVLCKGAVSWPEKTLSRAPIFVDNEYHVTTALFSVVDAAADYWQVASVRLDAIDTSHAASEKLCKADTRGKETLVNYYKSQKFEETAQSCQLSKGILTKSNKNDKSDIQKGLREMQKCFRPKNSANRRAFAPSKNDTIKNILMTQRTVDPYSHAAVLVARKDSPEGSDTNNLLVVFRDSETGDLVQNAVYYPQERDVNKQCPQNQTHCWTTEYSSRIFEEKDPVDRAVFAEADLGLLDENYYPVERMKTTYDIQL